MAEATTELSTSQERVNENPVSYTTDEPPPGFGGKPGDPLYIPPRKLWRHKKRGTTYEEIGRGELQMASDVVDGSEMVIYRGEDGRLWVREVSEFEDGRFEKVQP